MENSQNFRITLHLTHFFQDYRSISKIFVNSKMKCIADLENHVQQIFDLEKFYFISNGHYIPSTEDIRILQQDDVVIAIPSKKTENIRIGTSISIGSLNISQTKRKCTVDVDKEENVENTELNGNDGKNKKTKKKKKMKLDVYSNDENIEEPNSADESRSQQKQDSMKINKKRKKMWSPDISNFVKDSTQNFNNENKQNKNNIQNKLKGQKEYDSDNEELQGNAKDDSNSSVKDKVTYFEKHLHISGLKNKSKIIDETQPVVNETVDQKTSHQNILDCTNAIPTKEDSSDFSQKKLYIQKRNKDLISYDLPKKSNVVKSIVVSSNHSNNRNETNSINNTSTKIFQTPLKDSLEQKYKTFMSTLKSNIANQSTRKTNCLGAINTEIKAKSLPQLVFSQIKEKQPETNNSNNLPIEDKMIICDELHNCETEINVDNVASYQPVTSETNTVSLSENRQIEHNTAEDEVVNTTKPLNVNFEILDHFKISRENDSAIHSQTTSIPGSTKGSISYSEKEPSIQMESESISDRQDEDMEYFETPSFVTKRKRKRSHRKRKSKTNIDRESLPNIVESCYRKVPYISTKPTLHIKFNDDDEVSTVLENGTKVIDNYLEEKSFENVQEINGTDNVCSIGEQLIKNVTTENIQSTIIHIEETPKHSIVTTLKPEISNNIVQNEKASKNVHSTPNNCNKDRATILSDSMEEMKNALACSTPLISEDTIFKSPLMTSMKPKNRDIIAFKIFRLTNDYLPEISKYIIGEVRSYDEEKSNLEMNIIDGLDQCKEPDNGKFSVEPVNEDCYNVKSFCWYTLLEPRLIFP